MKNNKRNGSNKAKREYLLSDLIKCSSCGASYIGKCSTSKAGYETRYYVCGNKYRTHSCDAKNINANELETFVVASLKDYLSNLDFNECADEILSQLNSATDLKKEKAELAEVERKINNIVKSIMNGIIFDELQNELNLLKTRQQELKTIINSFENNTSKIKKDDIINKLKYDIENLASKTKTVVKDLVQIDVNKDGSCTVFIGFLMNDCGSRI